MLPTRLQFRRVHRRDLPLDGVLDRVPADPKEMRAGVIASGYHGRRLAEVHTRLAAHFPYTGARATYSVRLTRSRALSQRSFPLILVDAAPEFLPLLLQVISLTQQSTAPSVGKERSSTEPFF